MKLQKIAVLIVGLVLACMLPLILPSYYTFAVSITLCLDIYALGYNILLGRTGLLSFGHATLFRCRCLHSSLSNETSYGSVQSFFYGTDSDCSYSNSCLGRSWNRRSLHPVH